MNLIGPRQEKYSFDVFHRDGTHLGELKDVSGGGVQHNSSTELRHSGSITVVGNDHIDWLDAQLVVRYHFGDTAYQLGRFITETPKMSSDGMSRKREIEFYSKLVFLSQEVVPDTYIVPAGQKVTSAVRVLIGAPCLITESNETVRSIRTWDPGTTKLRIINDLLDSIDYFSLDVTPEGIFFAEPRTSPAAREVVWRFEKGQASIHKPEIETEADYFNVANRVILYSPGDIPLRSVVEDHTTQFSYESRGRWVDDYREEQNVTSQAVLDKKAARILHEASQVSEKVRIRHPFIPVLALNSAVEIVDNSACLLGKYVIHDWDHDFVLGASLTTNAKKVIVQ